MSSAPQRIRDSIIPFQVQLERVKEGSRKSVLRLLTQMEKDIYGEIMASDLYSPKRPTYREKRLKALLVQTNDAITRYSAKASKLNARDLERVATMSAEFAHGTVNEALGIQIAHGALSATELETIAGNVLIQGAPSKEWWGRQSVALKNKFADRIRQGFLRGDTTASIVRSIRGTRAAGYRDGIMKGTRQQVTSLVRTSIQTASNDANLAFYKKSDLIERIRWEATFDEKTTEICIGLDGLEWDASTYEPVGHTTPFPGPTAHWQCRSHQLPITISWEKLAKKNKKLAKRLDKKMSQDMKASLDGPIPAKTRYEDWLKTQPDVVVNKVLGKKKAQMWRDGKLSFRELIDESARPLNVYEIAPPARVPPMEEIMKQFRKEADYLRSTGRPELVLESEFYEPEEIWGWVQKARASRLGDEALKATKTDLASKLPIADDLVDTMGPVGEINPNSILSQLKEVPGAADRVAKLESFIVNRKIGSMFIEETQGGTVSQLKRLKDFRNSVLELSGRKGFRQAEHFLDKASGWTSQFHNMVTVKNVQANSNLLNFRPKNFQRHTRQTIQQGHLTARKSHTFSSRIGGDIEAVTTWLHELGHQVKFKAKRELFDDFDFNFDKSLTSYGETNADEFFAEHFVAWVIDYDTLVKYRPSVAKLIDKAMESVT
jgi:hypothetical protein